MTASNLFGGMGRVRGGQKTIEGTKKLLHTGILFTITINEQANNDLKETNYP